MPQVATKRGEMMAVENKIRTRVEIFVCLAIVALGTPLCVFWGVQSAQTDFATLNPEKTSGAPEEIKKLGFHR